MNPHHSIGACLAGARAKKDWSQAQLAERSGVSQSQISLIESGDRHNPGVMTLSALEKALDLEHGELSRLSDTRRKRKVS